MSKRNKNKFWIFLVVCFCGILAVAPLLVTANTSGKDNQSLPDFVNPEVKKVDANLFLTDFLIGSRNVWYLSHCLQDGFDGHDYNEYHQDENPLGATLRSCYCPVNFFCYSMGETMIVQAVGVTLEKGATVTVYKETAQGVTEISETYTVLNESDRYYSKPSVIYLDDRCVDFMFSFEDGHFFIMFGFNMAYGNEMIYNNYNDKEEIENYKNNYVLPAVNELLTDKLISFDGEFIINGEVEYHGHLARG
ncbi:MAG: hypothetical protein J6C23_09300 [Clostridia bacterium]|nr:hypothetical protein [Clostridia bacterium]